MAFFTLAYGVRHFRVPWGDDTFFYVDAVDRAGRLGLADSHLSARPAFPLIAASLRSLTGVSPWTAAVATPFAMAAGLGLAGAALAGRWGLGRWRLGAFAALVGASPVVVRLSAGKSENLMTLWLLAGALAVAALAPGRRGLVGAAVLVFAATITEWPFVAAFLAVVGATAAANAVFARTMGRAPSRDIRLPGTLLAGILGAAAGALVVFGLNATTPADAVQRLPPGFRYHARLADEIDLLGPVAAVVVLAAGWWAARRTSDAVSKGILRLLGVWTALTSGVVLVGLIGARLPTYRALTFFLPLALAAGAAPFVVDAEPGPTRGGLLPRGVDRPATRVALAVALGALAVVPSAVMWYRSLGPRTNPSQLGQIAAAARYGEAVGRTVVLVVNLGDPVRAPFYERLTDAVEGEGARPPVVAFAGRTADALAGRPTLTGDPGVDGVVREQFRAVAPHLRAGAAVVTGRDLDPPGFARAVSGGSPLVGDGLVVLRGPSPPPALRAPERFVPLPPWWTLAGVAVAGLAVMTASGIGWAGLASPSSPLAHRLALAPAFGATSIAVLALAAERVGVVPTKTPLVPLVAVAVGLLPLVTGLRTTARR